MGSQSIDHQKGIRLHLLDRAPEQVGGFHAGVGEHTRSQCGGSPQTGEGTVRGKQVPGHQQMFQCERAHRICRHGPISQSDHQKAAAGIRQQRLQLKGQAVDGPAEKM